MADRPALEIRGLVRRFPGTGRAALDGLDLALAEREVLVLVGPSGCGKSTALRLIAGLDDPDGGAITLGGRALSGVAPQDRDVAMVFQGYALYPHMSAWDNIAFPLKMRGVPRADRDRRVGDAARMLGLESLLKRLPGELSGGERQRVAIGRALVRSPRLFLFDEPLANLDAALRTQLRTELSLLLRKLEVAVIYVTHDQVEAMTVGDRIAVMRSGTIEQIGTPREVYERPATVFVAGFLGSPPCNFIDLDAAEADGSMTNGDVSVSRPPGAPDRAVLAVRPEELAVPGRNAAADAANDAAIRLGGKVTAVEPLGAESIVHVELPAKDAAGAAVMWRLRRPGFSVLARGDAIEIAAPRAALHWFDRETKRRIDLAASREGGDR